MSRIGELLVREKMLSLQQLQQAQDEAKRTGKRLGATLARLGYVNDQALTQFVAKQYSLPSINLAEVEIEPTVLKLIPREICEKHQVIPVRRNGPTLIVAMADPSNIFAIDELKFLTQYNIDPVVASAHIITALQTVASRTVSPLDSVVVSICSMATSQIGVFNVIPDHVKLVGTVRTFEAATRDLAERRVGEIATKTAEALGCTAEVTYERGYPATVNTAREAEFAAQVGRRVFGDENVITDHEPTMGGEDFSYLLQARPGAYVFLGQGGAAGGCLLHNPNYDFNDEVIPLGAGYLAALVEEALPLK